MKTKIIVSVVCILFAGIFFSYGQLPRAYGGNPSIQPVSSSRQNNNQQSGQAGFNADTTVQAVLSYFKGLTNLSQIEADAINQCLFEQSTTTPRHLLPDELPENYSRMNEAQRAVFTILFLSERKVRGFTTQDIDKQNDNRNAPWLPRAVIPSDPWRKLNGKPVFILSAGFSPCFGTVIQSFNGGVLVKSMPEGLDDYFINNFPLHVQDGYTIENIMAKKVGLKTFSTVFGATRTVTQFDYCEPCERPEGGEKIEDAYFAPILASIKKMTDEIESRIAENKAAAAAAKKRLSDFVQKIDDDKILIFQRKKEQQDLAKENAKKSALKYNQDAADKGDAYGLLRMGERYRYGEGVPKDLAKAKDYLTKAAAAGSPAAVEALKQLPAN